jgi:energy-coupling factor transport system substrate-specific component
VTWTAATFAILLASLAAGYAWYEHARPTARLAAMVATMAGLAALGRIAFAPLPDVKPTTDIIVLTGYVLGGAPGFAVGATGALASNVVFGQGPWTPWQMGAWGITGLLGAALGAATGRRVPRVPLALFCGAMGLLFGAIMDFSTLATFSGEHTLDQYLAISSTALPFNIAHAVGNVAFCLAFGPALVRALERFRARLHITWIPLEVTRS